MAAAASRERDLLYSPNARGESIDDSALAASSTELGLFHRRSTPLPSARDGPMPCSTLVLRGAIGADQARSWWDVWWCAGNSAVCRKGLLSLQGLEARGLRIRTDATRADPDRPRASPFECSRWLVVRVVGTQTLKSGFLWGGLCSVTGKT